MEYDKPTDVCKECGARIWGAHFSVVRYGSLNFCSDKCLADLKQRVSEMSVRVKKVVLKS